MKQLFMGLLLAVTVLISTGPTVAADVFGGVDCSVAPHSAVCQDKKNTANPLTGNDGAILKIANIVAVVAGIAAVIIIIISGLKFVTSGGDSNEVASARKAILGAVIGIVVIVSARLIIGLIVSRL